MEVSEAIEHRLEVREFSDDPVDDESKRAVLEAGRLAPSGKNRQHWRFVLVDDENTLGELAEHSETGDWVHDAAFAIVVTTDPQHPWHEIDAGRSVTYMQFAAWAEGVGSCIFTGYDGQKIRDLLAVPDDRAVPLVAGFGYPIRAGSGRKSRKSFEEIVFHERFGRPFEPEI